MCNYPRNLQFSCLGPEEVITHLLLLPLLLQRVCRFYLASLLFLLQPEYNLILLSSAGHQAVDTGHRGQGAFSQLQRAHPGVDKTRASQLHNIPRFQFGVTKNIIL